PQAARDFLSLPDLVALAEEVAGPEHRFRVVQLPYNLAMPEAFTLPNQGAGREVVPLIEAAKQLGVYVMSSASIYQGQLAKNLPPVIAQLLPGLDTDAQRALQFARSTPGVGTALVVMKTAALLAAGDSEIELLEPTRADTGVARFLDKHGEGLHDVCFETPDIDADLGAL